MPKLAQNPCFSRAPPPCRARNSSTWVKQITRFRKAHQCCIFHGCRRSFLPSTFLKYWNNQKNQTLHDWSSNHISRKTHVFFHYQLSIYPPKKKSRTTEERRHPSCCARCSSWGCEWSSTAMPPLASFLKASRNARWPGEVSPEEFWQKNTTLW